MHKKILVADDEQSIREFFQILFKRMSAETDYSFQMVGARDGQEAFDLLQKQSFDMVISDLKMPHLSGIELLEKTKSLYPDLTFLLVTAFDTSESAVRAMKIGAFDYIPKPFNVEEIKIIILSALNLKELEEKNQQLKRELEQEKGGSPLVGQSDSMKKIFKDIDQISHSTSNILITGESGTGKEVIARALHKKSSLRDRAFVAVNCGAVPETLIESEMFGHKRGSFTGAVVDKKGFFEIADGGTLFLDEIGELPIAVQPKLLRVLQEQVIRMVGGTADKKIKVRMIAATNRDLEKEVEAGLFREDLFYRLNVVRIHIPPLRDRREDIPFFVEHFHKKYSQRLNLPLKKISHSVQEIFQNYHYPGNVRELENLIERVLILSEKDEIQDVDILPFIQQTKKVSDKEMFVSLPEQGLDLEATIGDLEKKLLLEALKRSNGSKRLAANLLRLSSRALRYRLQKYQLDDFLSEEDR